MKLGKKIRQLRFKARLTQEQLAEKLCISPQAVSKWENDAAMPDIATLPLLAEVFGVSIDDLFDLTTEQRFNRIENRMELEEDLPQDVFREYEDFLSAQLGSGQHKKRATELMAALYWHRMDACAAKVRRYAKEAIRLSPREKGCQWMLQMAEGHASWDWNIRNHSKAIDFYRALDQQDPDSVLTLEYLMDNLLADRRADEAEQVLKRLQRLDGFKPVLEAVYRAHIALARFDAPEADRIMETLLETHPNDCDSQFEAAQYYADKCDYDKAIAAYERAFELEPRRPRFTDALQGIADIHRIRGDFRKAAETYDRIIDLLQTEWGMTEEVTLKDAQLEKARLLKLAEQA